MKKVDFIVYFHTDKCEFCIGLADAVDKYYNPYEDRIEQWASYFWSHNLQYLLKKFGEFTKQNLRGIEVNLTVV